MIVTPLNSVESVKDESYAVSNAKQGLLIDYVDGLATKSK